MTNKKQHKIIAGGELVPCRCAAHELPTVTKPRNNNPKFHTICKCQICGIEVRKNRRADAVAVWNEVMRERGLEVSDDG